ncbi:MAG: hypothetical protein FJ249_10920 [Nitrospira sp.]|nr:hypothetical protein [Nitrospira sp.]
MPRTARASVGGLCYHVINRGNARADVFRKPEDYAAFRELLQKGADRVRMRVLAYCVMPNHFHLAVWPRGESDLSQFMQWLLTSHVRRYHRHYQSRKKWGHSTFSGLTGFEGGAGRMLACCWPAPGTRCWRGLYSGSRRAIQGRQPEFGAALVTVEERRSVPDMMQNQDGRTWRIMASITGLVFSVEITMAG